MSLMPVGLRFKHLEYAIKCGSSARKTPLSAMVSRHFKQRNAYPINSNIRCYSVLPKKGALQNNPVKRTLFQERQIPPIPQGAFGKAEWKRGFNVDVGEVPPLPADIQEKLDAPCPFWLYKRIRDTHLLVLIPASINGQPYHLNALRELTVKRVEWLSFDAEHSKTPPPKSHWVLMPKDVVPGSRNKNWAELKKIAEDAGRLLPTPLQAATVILAHYALTGKEIFRGYDPRVIYMGEPEYTFTGCRDQTEVGGFVGCPFGPELMVFTSTRARDQDRGAAPLHEF